MGIMVPFVNEWLWKIDKMSVDSWDEIFVFSFYISEKEES